MKNVNEKAVQKAEKAQPVQQEREYVPTTDVYEKENAVLIRCDMPGVAQEDVDIRLDNNELEIVAKQKDGRPGGLDLLIGEYATGVFRRKFSIPQLIDRDGIKARLHQGVLDLELPKAEQAVPRKIEVTTGG